MTTPFQHAVRLTWCLGSLALASGCGDAASAADLAPVGEAASHLHGSPNDGPIEGETSSDHAWLGGPPVTHFSGSLRRDARKVLLGEAVSPDDLALEWQASWSEASLRLRVTVRDDVLVRDSAEPWEDDSFEIYLDPDFSRGATYDGRNDYQLVFRLDDPTPYLGVNAPARTDGIEVNTTASGTPYHVTEVKIPWALLGVSPVAGQQIGIDVHVNDDDDGGARDTKRSALAEQDDAWTRPASFGAVRLGPKVTAPGSHQLRVQVQNAVTGAPVEGAYVQAGGVGHGIMVASKETSAEGLAILGSCGYEDAPLTTYYDIANYAIEVMAPGFEDARSDVFAPPLLAWCTEVVSSIRLKPKP